MPFLGGLKEHVGNSILVVKGRDQPARSTNPNGPGRAAGRELGAVPGTCGDPLGLGARFTRLSEL